MCAYDEIYFDCARENVACCFEVALRNLGLDPDDFAVRFATSSVARGIERGEADMLAGKSGAEYVELILDRDLEEQFLAMDRSPAYWGGWVLAQAQWQLNRSFADLLAAVPFSRLLALYHPYHEADEQKTVDFIAAQLDDGESTRLNHTQNFSSDAKGMTT